MIVSKIEKESLLKALNFCSVSELPEALSEDSDGVWAIGIAKVKKNDGSTSYSVVKNDGTGKPVIYVDYGRPAIIVSIEEIYPSSYLNQDNLPSIRSKKDISRYLSEHGEDKKIIEDKMDSKDDNDKEYVKSLVYKHAINDLLIRF